MKTKFLLPYRIKKLGWILFFPALILACIQFFGGIEPDWLNFRVVKVFGERGDQLVEMGRNNIADEIVASLLLISCMLLVFGRERDEDEFIMKLRLESILWAALVNGLVVLIAIVLTYDFTFFYIMVFNLFLLFLLFIARFHWVLMKFRRQAE